MDKELKQQTAMFGSFYQPCMLKAIVEIVHIKLFFNYYISKKLRNFWQKKKKRVRIAFTQKINIQFNIYFERTGKIFGKENNFPD